MTRLLLTFALLNPFAGNAATAVLNCVSGADTGRMLLIDFRSASAEGWKVERAFLFLRPGPGKTPERVRVSTVPSAWTEKTASQAARTAFRRPAVSGVYIATALPEGWIRVDIAPALVEQMAAGTSFGLAIEHGRAHFQGLAPVSTQPYLIVDGTPAR